MNPEPGLTAKAPPSPFWLGPQSGCRMCWPRRERNNGREKEFCIDNRTTPNIKPYTRSGSEGAAFPLLARAVALRALQDPTPKHQTLNQAQNINPEPGLTAKAPPFPFWLGPSPFELKLSATSYHSLNSSEDLLDEVRAWSLRLLVSGVWYMVEG